MTAFPHTILTISCVHEKPCLMCYFLNHNFKLISLMGVFRSVLPVADYDNKEFPTPENRPDFFEHH